MTVHDEVGAFYEHARVLEGILRELELSIRLEPGDALLVDNHRVLHGRHIFAGNRAMVGCYMKPGSAMLAARIHSGQWLSWNHGKDAWAEMGNVLKTLRS